MRFEQAGYRFMGAALIVAATVSHASAQTSVKVGDKELQFHGFMQQGFASSSGNNFLTMDTRDGSVALTDGGMNASMMVTKKLRVGFQIYSRNIGDLGDGHVQLDWGFADYRFADWIGVRGGKVKTTLGLVNDSQDMEFLHTWAFLPQAVYPLDLRSITIAHTGGDVYGTIALKKAGSLAYTVYGGVMPDDKQGGYRYGINDANIGIDGSLEFYGGGGDLRWTSPVEGLQLGYSYLHQDFHTILRLTTVPFPLRLDADGIDTNAIYADYQKDNWHFATEWRQRYTKGTRLTPLISPPSSTKARGWFVSGAYRVAKPVEVGAYYEKFISNANLDASLDNNHISGPALTTRIDFARYFSVKVEGHFYDGYGDPYSAHGFYPRNNASGYKDKTNMLVVRTAFSF
jgi:hypothetical protein